MSPKKTQIRVGLRHRTQPLFHLNKKRHPPMKIINRSQLRLHPIHMAAIVIIIVIIEGRTVAIPLTDNTITKEITPITKVASKTIDKTNSHTSQLES